MIKYFEREYNIEVENDMHCMNKEQMSYSVINGR